MIARRLDCGGFHHQHRRREEVRFTETCMDGASFVLIVGKGRLLLVIGYLTGLDVASAGRQWLRLVAGQE